MNEEEVTDVLERIYSGEPLTKILPAARERMAFFALVDRNEGLRQAYARAQSSRAEMFADEIVSIADEEPDAQIARVKIDARKWYASKIKPDKYGESIDLRITERVDLRAIVADSRARSATSVLPDLATRIAARQQERIGEARPPDQGSDFVPVVVPFEPEPEDDGGIFG